MNMTLNFCDIMITNINSILTGVSIILTILNFIWYRNTKRIRDRILDKLNGYELISYIERFNSIYLETAKKIRAKDWNKAGKNNNLIDDIESVLRNFNKYEYKIQKDIRENIKTEVLDTLKSLTPFRDGTANEYQKGSLLTKLDSIDESLMKIREDLNQKPI